MLYYKTSPNGFDFVFPPPNKLNLGSKTYVIAKLKSEEKVNFVRKGWHAVTQMSNLIFLSLLVVTLQALSKQFKLLCI